MFTVTTGGDFVKRKLSPWCKEIKKTLIDRDMTVTDLCEQVRLPLILMIYAACYPKVKESSYGLCTLKLSLFSLFM